MGALESTRYFRDFSVRSLAWDLAKTFVSLEGVRRVEMEETQVRILFTRSSRTYHGKKQLFVAFLREASFVTPGVL